MADLTVDAIALEDTENKLATAAQSFPEQLAPNPDTGSFDTLAATSSMSSALTSALMGGAASLFKLGHSLKAAAATFDQADHDLS